MKDLRNWRPWWTVFSPDKVAPITGIEERTIERLAREYARYDKAVLYGRMGLSTQPHGGLCHWLIVTINIISGHFDRVGGMMFPSPAIELVRTREQRHVFGRWTSRVRGLKEFGGELPVSAMTDELVTRGAGQVKAFISICGNPVLSSPNGKRLDEALPKLEFMVSIDNYINETTRHADLILPTPSGLEIDHYDLVFNALSAKNNVKFSEALFPPSPDRPYDWQVLKELASRVSVKGLSLVDRIKTPRRLVNLGLLLGPYGKLSSPRRWFNGLSLRKVIRSKHGISLGPLRPRVPECLLTHDKKIHLADPVFLKRLETLTSKEFPRLSMRTAKHHASDLFRCIGRRNVNTNNSWMHQVKTLSASKQVRCTAMLNSRDAERLGLGDGEQVKIVSRVGEILIPIETTPAMMPGVLSIPHGFGHHRSGTRVPNAEAKPGVSVNDITDHEIVDELTGNAAFSGQVVQLIKISDHIVASADSGKPLTVMYGSQSGNAEMIALDIARHAAEYELLVNVLDMDDVIPADLTETERILVIASTFGDGEMPDNASLLWDALLSDDAPDLSRSHFSVLGLGDSSYEQFCEAASSGIEGWRNWAQPG